LHLQIKEGSAESVKKEAKNIEKKTQKQEVEPALRRKAFQASLFSEAMLAKHYLEKVSHTHSRHAHARTHTYAHAS
jgi:translation elongation factor EF-G